MYVDLLFGVGGPVMGVTDIDFTTAIVIAIPGLIF